MKYKPQIICGDFDSIDKQVLEYYSEDDDVKVIRTADQNHTDFSKAVMVLREEAACRKIHVDQVVAVYESGGRMDHELANINTLYEQLTLNDFGLSPPLYIITESDVALVLPVGRHTVHVDKSIRGSHCGLLPLGHPVRCRTSGLIWELTPDRVLQFGGLVSACNRFKDDVDHLEVECDANILLTITHRHTKHKQ